MVWMRDALAEGRLGSAGDQVRVLRWHVERLRAAIERDPSRRGRAEVVPSTPPDLRLPDTLGAVREAYRRHNPHAAWFEDVAPLKAYPLRRTDKPGRAEGGSNQ
jgi:hypothetical protein